MKKYTANALPTTILSTKIENRVKNYLQQQNVSARVHIRIVATCKKKTLVKDEMRSVFSSTDFYPYQAKTLLAFVEINGNDVCFFAAYFHEYCSDCPPPNTRRIYISYIDSVNFFEPKQHRSMVYNEILMGYMEHARALGYTSLHLWACPPQKGDEYVFYSHPPDQKIPAQARLQKWYEAMFTRGKDAGIIESFRTLTEEDIETVSDLPYFDGNFWTTVLENIIKKLKKTTRRKV